MLRASVDMVCEDIHPFEVVSGPGFINLVQEALYIQRSHKGRIAAEDLLPHPTI